MNFRPAFDRIIITPVEKPKTKGGIILPESDTNPWMYARVEAIGDLVTRVGVGDIILLYKCDATPLEIEENPYGHIRETHIIGLCQKEKND